LQHCVRCASLIVPDLTHAATILAKWWDNGVSHSFNWFPISRGEDGNGWLSLEIVMVRLNQSYTAPDSSFQVYGELGANRTRIGFDAAVCLEEVRGYVLDVYNSVSFLTCSLGARTSTEAPLRVRVPQCRYQCNMPEHNSTRPPSAWAKTPPSL
jgi:hypothetical protein